MEGLGALVAQLLPLGCQGVALLPEFPVLDEAFVVQPLEGVGLFVQLRQGAVDLIQLGVAPLLPGGDFLQQGEGGGEEGVTVGIEFTEHGKGCANYIFFRKAYGCTVSQAVNPVRTDPIAYLVAFNISKVLVAVRTLDAVCKQMVNVIVIAFPSPFSQVL